MHNNKFVPIVEKPLLSTSLSPLTTKSHLQSILPVPSNVELPDISIKDLETIARDVNSNLNMLIVRYVDGNGKK